MNINVITSHNTLPAHGICSTISLTSIGRRFVQKYTIVDLFSYFIYFSNTLSNAPLSDLSWKTEKCRPEDLRGGAFSIRQVKPSSKCSPKVA